MGLKVSHRMAPKQLGISFFFNKLFDSFNGLVKRDPHSDFRTLLTDTSYHLSFFDEAISVLARMRFVNKETKKSVPKQPSCLENLVKTIRGFKKLWYRLKESSLTRLKTIHINQDPLENFFFLVRGFSADKKPNCYHFIGIFKVLVINTITQCTILEEPIAKMMKVILFYRGKAISQGKRIVQDLFVKCYLFSAFYQEVGVAEMLFQKKELSQMIPQN